MQIQTSIPSSSKYCLFLDVPYRYGLRHMKIAFKSHNNVGHLSPSLTDRAKHFSLGIIHLIPAIGHIAAIITYILNLPQGPLSSNENPKLPPQDFPNDAPFKKGDQHWACMGFNAEAWLQDALQDGTLAEKPTFDLISFDLPNDRFIIEGAQFSMGIHWTYIRLQGRSGEKGKGWVPNVILQKEKEINQLEMINEEMLVKTPFSSFSSSALNVYQTQQIDRENRIYPMPLGNIHDKESVVARRVVGEWVEVGHYLNKHYFELNGWVPLKNLEKKPKNLN